MSENKKERFTTYLPIALIEKVRELSEESRIPQARLFEEAVEDLLKKYKKDYITELILRREIKWALEDYFLF